MSWELTGNAGTDLATNFLGTTDNEPLVIKTNGTEQLRIDSAGNVGIGTTLPTGGKLTIAGVPTPSFGIHTQTDSQGRGILLTTTDYNYDSGLGSSLYISMGSGTGNTANSQIDAMNNAVNSGGNLILQGSGGNVGIGTTNPGAKLEVRSDSGIGIFTHSTNGNGLRGITDSSNNSGVYGVNTAEGIGVFGRGGPNGGEGVFGQNTSSSSAVYGKNTSGGNGVTGESANGIGVYGQGPQNAGFFHGNVTVTGDIILSGADCAEEFDIAEIGDIEPGTVMVLDQDGALHQSQQAYDKRVAGVISGAGDYKAGLILDRQQSQDNRLPVALVGKVYCKVDARYAPIEVGDLLTTSPTPGHAMKADDPFKAFGSVIGKALQALQNGQELVPILVALQ